MTDISLMPRSIKTAKKVFRYMNETTPTGTPLHDVYYDRVSNVFIIEDFPTKGDEFEVGVTIEDGFAWIMVDDTEYQIRVYEQ